MSRTALLEVDDTKMDLDVEAFKHMSPREIRQQRTEVFGNRFNHALRVRGFNSLIFFAQISKCSYSKVVAWSTKRRCPRGVDYALLCPALDVTEAWLKGEVPLLPMTREV